MEDKKFLEITNFIYIIRDQKVMIDRDLAELYEVEVKALNQAVKRNKERFPEELCFQLTSNEFAETKSENKTLIEPSSRKSTFNKVFQLVWPD